jgi:hypothetical protein
VALAEAARPGVELSREKFRAEPLVGARRVEDKTELQTPKAGRATVRLDSGSWLLVDEQSRIGIYADHISLLAGRVWVDARQADGLTLNVPGGTLTAAQSGFSVELDAKGAHAYCVSGQLTWAAKGAGNRLESGMSVVIDQGGTAKELPEGQWDDWTGGLAEPGPLRPDEPAGVGLLAARRADELGEARTPLIVRRHDVRAAVQADRVVVDVEQVFFNPRSDNVEGLYTLRLPPGAVPVAFDVVDGESGPGLDAMQPSTVPVAAGGGGVMSTALEWAGPDRYRARVTTLRPGKTCLVKIRWIEWLNRHATRRTWVYPMAGANPPLLGEFSLEVDTREAGSELSLEAGMGARVEGHKVVLRKSDFRPRADFALDLLDSKPKAAAAVYMENAGFGDPGRGYIFAGIEPPFGAPPQAVEMVLLVDASAATDPGRLELERAVVDALLRQLTPADKVAVLSADLAARPVDKAGLAPVDKARIESLVEGLARTAPAGATDLGAALTQAAKLLPAGRGVLVYLGDGRPTVGAMTPAALDIALERLGARPRIFTVAAGGDPRMDVMHALGRGGLVTRVEDHPDAARAAYRIMAAAAQPSLRNVTVDFGSSVDVAYPSGPMTLVAGEPFSVIARLRGPAPQKLTLHGLRDGKPFTEEVALRPTNAETRGDLRRRWARGRLQSLLARGAGREALTEVGTHFGVVTPFSAMLPLSGANNSAYRPVQLENDGAWTPDTQFDAPPTDGSIAFEAAPSPQATTDLGPLYVRLIGEREEGPRACFDQKAASRPDLGGRVEIKVKIGLGGEVLAAQLGSTTLRSADVEACILRAVKALRLPPPPDSKPHDVVAAYLFEAEDARLGAGRRCSGGSIQYLSARRQLWRERLASNGGVEGAMAVWRQALRSCELKTWLDKKALLDLMRPHVGPTLYQVDLYHRFNGQADVQAYLRREVLRAVRTAADVQAVRGGLALDGGMSMALLEQLLKKQTDNAARTRIVKQFLALAPDSVPLRLALLKELIAGKKISEARLIADSLRADPGADADTREAVGEQLSLVDPDEGARAFTEIVEYAPYDPWARRRLGDLLLAHNRAEDAYREYQTLAWLVPNDPAAALFVARSAEAAKRTDEALRLEEKLSEAVDAKVGGTDTGSFARHHLSLLLARLRSDARRSKDNATLSALASRSRAAGVLGWARPLLVAVTSTHPRARLELWLTSGDDKTAARATVQGNTAGIEAERRARTGPLKLEVKCAANTICQGDLWVLLDEGTATEQLLRLDVTPEQRRFSLAGKELSVLK